MKKCTCNSYDTNAKLIDFGLGTTNSHFTKDSPLCGSPGYMAPELFSDNAFGPKSDIYSCGIVLYFMLSGALPFNGTTHGEILVQNKRNCIKFPGCGWAKVSKEAKDFISELTNTDPEMRPTATEALENAWFNKVLQDGFMCATPKTDIESPASTPCPGSSGLSFGGGFSSVISKVTVKPKLGIQKVHPELSITTSSLPHIKENSSMTNLQEKRASLLPKQQIKERPRAVKSSFFTPLDKQDALQEKC